MKVIFTHPSTMSGRGVFMKPLPSKLRNLHGSGVGNIIRPRCGGCLQGNRHSDTAGQAELTETVTVHLRPAQFKPETKPRAEKGKYTQNPHILLRSSFQLTPIGKKKNQFSPGECHWLY